MMKAIETIALTKYYGKHRGIEGVDLSVSEGDFFGFIGPNGAGKSTTIRTLLGLIKPNSGEARVLGMNTKTELNEILKNVGYLPSETVFYRGMKVSEILSLSAKLRGVDTSNDAAELCERLQLDIHKKAEELSFGNRKKLGIVCALQHRPSLYILDEPTSGLDPLMQREFYSVLKERNAEGATVFLSSHVLSEVSRYCSTAAVIREGKIIACDSVENLGHTGVKRVTLRGVSGDISLAGAKDIKSDGDTVSFLYGEGPRRLAEEIVKLSFEDYTVTDPDLEEVFMHYYGKGDQV